MFGQVLAEVYVRVNTIARYSSPPLSAFPFDPVRLDCEKYGRRGQYRKATLIERHGPDNRRARSISCDRECPGRKALGEVRCGIYFWI
jgi:hypothetical protein